jgi:hypothetical protein
MAEKAEEENTESFRAEVEKEFVFLQSFPVLDDKARKEAEKEREILKKKLRNSQREYNGPPLILDTAIQAENDRQIELQKEINKISARWSRIRKVANIKYLGWANTKLEKMFKKAKVDLVHEDFNHIKLKESIADAEKNNRKLRNYGKTGSGNGFENPPQSTTTTTNPQK